MKVLIKIYSIEMMLNLANQEFFDECRVFMQDIVDGFDLCPEMKQKLFDYLTGFIAQHIEV